MNKFELLILSLMTVLMFGHSFFPDSFFTRRIFSKVVVPLSLLILWFLALTYQSFQIENVFTIITTSHSRKDLVSYPAGELTQGQKISGTFVADQNHMGIFGFRFWTYYRLNDDYLTFRLKEKSSANWYYTNTYKSDQFQPNQYFTFGFPEVPDSKGKIYQFEIESTAGVNGDAVGVSQVDPVYIVKYKFPRSVLNFKTNSAINFLGLKLMNLSTNPNFKASTYVFMLPCIVYVIFVFGIESFIKTKSIEKVCENISVILSDVSPEKKKSSRSILLTESLTLCLLGLLIDILVIKSGDLPLLILLSAFIFTLRSYKIKYQLYFFLGLILLAMSFIFLYANLGPSSERSGAWAWIFLFIWIVIELWQQRNQP